MSLSRRRRETTRDVGGLNYRRRNYSIPPHICPSAGDWLEDLPTVIAIKESQVTDSESHPTWRRRKYSAPLRDIGGDFFTQRRHIILPAGAGGSASHGKNLSTQCRQDQVIYGPIYAISPAGGTSSFPTPTSSSGPAELDILGATAVSRSSPLNSAAYAAVLLGELYREGIPDATVRTWEKRVKTGRDAGSDYLNFQFGWRPLVNEVSSFASGVARAGAIIDQLYRDSGKAVRRRYEFPLEQTQSVSERSVTRAPFAGRTIPSDFYGSGSSWTEVTVTERRQRRWFSGAFTYHMPPVARDGHRDIGYWLLKADDLSKVFGLDPTPDVLWNLAPWSWAIDWFSNFGDVISNISERATDSLVMRYGYVMEHTIDKRTILSKTSPIQRGYGLLTPVTFVTETKIRRKANPFGFGVSWEGLSPFQLSIAAALGIARS